MKLIKTEEAVGHILCQDMTQIIAGKSKGPRFKKGHVVTEKDVPVLLSMGKVNLYVWEMEPGMVHENDAAHRLAELCLGPGCVAAGEPSEGKIGINAARDGVLLVNSERLRAVNATDEVMVATRKGGFAVREGDALAGTRVIPLVVREEVLAAAEAAAAGEKLLEVRPFSARTAAVIATGSEVASGFIEDAFTPVMEAKLAAFGIEVTYRATPGDEMGSVVAAIDGARAEASTSSCARRHERGPDDNTPGAIKRAGARIVTYGSPVLPGAMLLVGYFDETGADGHRHAERARAGRAGLRHVQQGHGARPGASARRGGRAACQGRLRRAGRGRPVPGMFALHLPALPLRSLEVGRGRPLCRLSELGGHMTESVQKAAYTAAVITVSDRGAAGEREDASGPALVALLAGRGYDVVRTAIVPDERTDIERELRSCAEADVALVLTTGGTGFSPRDVTPGGHRRGMRAHGARHSRGHAGREHANHRPRVPLSRGGGHLRSHAGGEPPRQPQGRAGERLCGHRAHRAWSAHPARRAGDCAAGE